MYTWLFINLFLFLSYQGNEGKSLDQQGKSSHLSLCSSLTPISMLLTHNLLTFMAVRYGPIVGQIGPQWDTFMDLFISDSVYFGSPRWNWI